MLHESHSVVCAGDGNEAIRQFQAEPFDLVITDLVMPDKEGLELIIELRAKYPSVKIIAMTGGSGNSVTYLKLADSFGVSKTLLKPFGRNELLKAVQSTLEDN